MVEDWEMLQSETLANYRIFTVRQDTRRSPRTGNVHNFFVLDAADWVNIIPITPDGKVVFIRQFRHGTAAVTLEIPGGVVDETDADPQTAAYREMLEETGYDARQIIHIGIVEPNPAFLNNRCHTYLALGACWKQAPQFDGAEDISTEEIDLTAVPSLITSGQITHALVVAAFYHLDQVRRQQPDLFNFANGRLSPQ
ncbi:MAG: NUDIX hydrolase [Ardenticatenaceae bacterium]|nr:NUDIX hydrolase [Ardenticatenaceae bacterium]MCB8987671.1 NUDIX hydrolase [Ardenticatenaceae bacterium]